MAVGRRTTDEESDTAVEEFEPDYRFTLANERTFLAWLRTGLALLAGAVALAQIVPPFPIAGLRTGLAALLAVTGTLLSAFSLRRWARVQRAMRDGSPLPGSG